MNLYRFSPISGKKDLLNSIQYVIDESQKLSKKLIGKNLAFSGYLTICSHYYEEFNNLQVIQKQLGQIDSEHNGFYVKLDNPIQTKYGTIIKFRVRNPDPYRFQVGCGDFVVDNYLEFREKYLKNTNPYIREIIRPEITMIEFWHPDFDVTTYVVKKYSN